MRTATPPQLPAALIEAGTAVLQANHAYRSAWWNFSATLEPLPVERFWELLAHLQKEIETFRFGYKRTDGVEDATAEFFRKALVGDAPYTLDECYRFYVTYQKVESKLSRRLTRLFDFHGDSFDDLLDSLPLAGHHICEELRFETEDDLRAALDTLSPQWKKFIGDENYVHMNLEKAAKRYLLSVITDQLPEGVKEISVDF
jgi:hypothetical protein